jgi:hypothetical protein
VGILAEAIEMRLITPGQQTLTYTRDSRRRSASEACPPPVVVVKDQTRSSCTAEEPGGGKKSTKKRPLSWPRALRKVRSWLQPYVMLLRYWRANTVLPPPKELQRLLEKLFCGEGLYLYAH